jgi:membrane protease YdiL (CAAX protease family)
MVKEFIKSLIKAIAIAIISLAIPYTGIFVGMIAESIFPNIIFHEIHKSPFLSYFNIISIILGIIIAYKMKFDLKIIGVNIIQKNTLKPMLFFLPLIVFYLIKTVFLSNRFYTQPNFEIILLIIGTLTAVVREEIYYRGVILTLFKKNINAAIIITTLLFGIYHIFVGWSTVLTSIPLGLVYAVITIISKSLGPAIIFHFIHNITIYIADLTGEHPNSDGYIVMLQQIVMLGYAIILWRKIKHINSPNIAQQTVIESGEPTENL